MLIQASPVLRQDSSACAERIRPAKTAVQSTVHQGTALGTGQTHVAQAAHHRPEQIGSQVIQRAGWGALSRRGNAWGRFSRLVWFRRQWGTELTELGQMRFALA